MNLDLSISGETTDDLALALERTLVLVREGYTCGFDLTDSCRFRFDVSGEGTNAKELKFQS